MTDPTTPTDSQKKYAQLLEKMLKEHEEWLDCTDNGKPSDGKPGDGKPKQFCINNWPQLWKLNNHFRNRDLRHAIFDGCIVQDVDFSGSLLHHASFIGALARRAIFHGADCTAANFSRCALTSAKFDSHTKLNFANLWSATGPFVTGCFGQHPAVAYADVAAIGCELHPIDFWLEHGREYGLANEYKKVEIDAYLAWLKLAKKVLAHAR